MPKRLPGPPRINEHHLMNERMASAVALVVSILAVTSCGGRTELDRPEEGQSIPYSGEAGWSEGDSGGTSGTTLPCNLSRAEREHDEALTTAAATCGPIDCRRDRYRLRLDSTGRVVDIEFETGVSADATTVGCYFGVLAPQTFPCLARHEVWEECHMGTAR